MNRALLVIDVQNIYTNPESEMVCEEADKTVANINKLIGYFKHKNEKVIYIRHIHKKDGSDLGRMFDFAGEPEEEFNFKEGDEEVEYDAQLEILKGSKHIIKNRYSAFIGTDLEQTLRQDAIEKVVVCGFMTNFCCESTARDAHDRDYFVDFIIDATGTPGTENYDQDAIKQTIGELLEEGFAVIHTTDNYVANS